MKFKYILFTFCTMLILSSCKKHVVDISPEYEGEWHSQITTGADGIPRERYLIIDGEQAVFGELCELAPLGHNCIRKFSGDVKFNYNKSKIFIGTLIGRAVLEIDESAHMNSDGNWECTILSSIYIRN